MVSWHPVPPNIIWINSSTDISGCFVFHKDIGHKRWALRVPWESRSGLRGLGLFQHKQNSRLENFKEFQWSWKYPYFVTTVVTEYRQSHFLLVGHSCTYPFVVSKFILARTSLLVTTSVKCGCHAAKYHSASSVQMGTYSSVPGGKKGKKKRIFTGMGFCSIVLNWWGSHKQSPLYTALIKRA